MAIREMGVARRQSLREAVRQVIGAAGHATIAMVALAVGGCDQRPTAQTAAPTVPVAAQPQTPASEPEAWGSEEEYGEYLAAPQELIAVPVNTIVESMRLNAQAMLLGETVYEKHCAECHGADLQGLANKNTADLTDNLWRFSGDDRASVGHVKLPSDVEYTVRYGIRADNAYTRGLESDMLAYDPRFRTKEDVARYGTTAYLSEAEIVDMVEYVLQLSGQPHDAAKAGRAAVLFQDNTRGNCFDCHGRDGSGREVFGTTDLTNKKAYLYGADRASIQESITKGRYGAMPAFEGVLKPEELKAVSVYTFSLAQK